MQIQMAWKVVEELLFALFPNQNYGKAFIMHLFLDKTIN